MEVEKMKKSTTLKFHDFINNYKYYDFYKCRSRIDGKLKNGYLYKLCDYTQADIDALKKYKNIKLFCCVSEYAPEIRKAAVFVAHSDSHAQNAKNIIG